MIKSIPIVRGKSYFKSFNYLVYRDGSVTKLVDARGDPVVARRSFDEILEYLNVAAAGREVRIGILSDVYLEKEVTIDAIPILEIDLLGNTLYAKSALDSLILYKEIDGRIAIVNGVVDCGGSQYMLFVNTGGPTAIPTTDGGTYLPTKATVLLSDLEVTGFTRYMVGGYIGSVDQPPQYGNLYMRNLKVEGAGGLAGIYNTFRAVIENVEASVKNGMSLVANIVRIEKSVVYNGEAPIAIMGNSVLVRDCYFESSEDKDFVFLIRGYSNGVGKSITVQNSDFGVHGMIVIDGGFGQVVMDGVSAPQPVYVANGMVGVMSVKNTVFTVAKLCDEYVGEPAVLAVNSSIGALVMDSVSPVPSPSTVLLGVYTSTSSFFKLVARNVIPRGNYIGFIACATYGSSSEASISGIIDVDPIAMFDLHKHGGSGTVAVGALKNGGVASFTGDGSTTQFKIPTGLIEPPVVFYVEPIGSTPKPDSVSVSGTDIVVSYSTAPASGTSLRFAWYAETKTTAFIVWPPTSTFGTILPDIG